MCAECWLLTNGTPGHSPHVLRPLPDHLRDALRQFFPQRPCGSDLVTAGVVAFAKYLVAEGCLSASAPAQELDGIFAELGRYDDAA